MYAYAIDANLISAASTFRSILSNAAPRITVGATSTRRTSVANGPVSALRTVTGAPLAPDPQCQQSSSLATKASRRRSSLDLRNQPTVGSMCYSTQPVNTGALPPSAEILAQLSNMPVTATTATTTTSTEPPPANGSVAMATTATTTTTTTTPAKEKGNISPTHEHRKSSGGRRHRGGSNDLWACSLCNVQPMPARFNLERHIWTNHVRRMTGAPRDAAFNTRIHKSLVTPYMVRVDRTPTGSMTTLSGAATGPTSSMPAARSANLSGSGSPPRPKILRHTSLPEVATGAYRPAIPYTRGTSQERTPPTPATAPPVLTNTGVILPSLLEHRRLITHSTTGSASSDGTSSSQSLNDASGFADFSLAGPQPLPYSSLPRAFAGRQISGPEGVSCPTTPQVRFGAPSASLRRSLSGPLPSIPATTATMSMARPWTIATNTPSAHPGQMWPSTPGAAPALPQRYFMSEEFADPVMWSSPTATARHHMGMGTAAELSQALEATSIAGPAQQQQPGMTTSSSSTSSLPQSSLEDMVASILAANRHSQQQVTGQNVTQSATLGGPAVSMATGSEPMPAKRPQFPANLTPPTVTNLSAPSVAMATQDRRAQADHLEEDVAAILASAPQQGERASPLTSPTAAAEAARTGFMDWEARSSP